jgi:hypothetical protein
LRHFAAFDASIAAKFPIRRHNADTLHADLAGNITGKEGIMAAGVQCCRYEPTLDELLDDDIMTPVLRSAGFDPQGFRAMMAETARRFDDRQPGAGVEGEYRHR